MRAPRISHKHKKVNFPSATTLLWVPIATSAMYGVVQGASTLPPEMRVPAITAGLAGTGLSYVILKQMEKKK